VHFGENYAQELTEKAELLPKSIQWHFIGGLQSSTLLQCRVILSHRRSVVLLPLFSLLYRSRVDNFLDKCKPLASSIPNLFCVSSVDSLKKATQLDSGRSTLISSHPELKDTPLNIHIQVNTSGEESKSGTSPGPETTELAKHIIEKCPHLKLLGLMTIGAIARSKETGEGKENEDFVCLKHERDRLEEELCVKLELSMGMSEDFEGAIKMGSGEVRVGSTIFGERPPKSEAKV
jgi:pyridoxal phosphate enzyme (YggS family)